MLNIPKKFYFIFVIIVAVVLCFVSIKPGTNKDKQYKDKLDTAQTSEDTNKNQQEDNTDDRCV